MNTTYWLWYALDFIPAVNASPLEDLHIDPAIGAGGVALGILINSVTILYPKSTISKITYEPLHHRLAIYNHSLPLLHPSTNGKEYPLGQVKLDPTSTDVKTILQDLEGDLTQFQGHLGISCEDKSIPMLLELRNTAGDGNNPLHHPDLLLQALLDPQALLQPQDTKKKTKRKQSNKGKRSNKR